MKIKLDESIPVVGREVLETVGHDVESVPDEGLTGATDASVVGRASEERRLLITLDRGMADIRAHPPGSHGGIVVLRLDDQAVGPTVTALRSLAEHHDLATFAGCNVVVRGHLVRVRRPS